LAQLRLHTDFPLRKLYTFWGVGFLARFISSFFALVAPDYVYYRLPIAQCISSGQTLYCDCNYNHTPLYPYLSGFLDWLSPANEYIQVMLITLPLTIGDALVPLLILLIFQQLGHERTGIMASIIYALNPISIIEVGLAHWDGMTTLCFLVSLYYLHRNEWKLSGIAAAFGTLLKQFPLAILLIAFVRDKKFWRTTWMGLIIVGIVLIGFLPFLINCPETFIQNLLGHPLWKGAASEKVGIGTVKDLFGHLYIPSPKIIWLILFVGLIGVPALRTNERNYVFYTALVMVTLAYFTYVTHRQLVVWALPFMIALCVDMKKYWPLVVVAIGYAIRIIKPDWYFGLIHLGIGVWFYYQFWIRINQYRKTDYALNGR
jgi:hypothetical protein